MTRLVLFMARRRTSWYLWMALGVLPYFLTLLADFLWQALVSMHHAWTYQWRRDTVEFFRAFRDAHRESLRSLALRPEPGGFLEKK